MKQLWLEKVRYVNYNNNNRVTCTKKLIFFSSSGYRALPDPPTLSSSTLGRDLTKDLSKSLGFPISDNTEQDSSHDVKPRKIRKRFSDPMDETLGVKEKETAAGIDVTLIQEPTTSEAPDEQKTEQQKQGKGRKQRGKVGVGDRKSKISGDTSNSTTVGIKDAKIGRASEDMLGKRVHPTIRKGRSKSWDVTKVTLLTIFGIDIVGSIFA